MSFPRRCAFRLLLAANLSLAGSTGGGVHAANLDPGNLARVPRNDAVGFSDPAKSTLVREDAHFWIASMTQPMTAARVLMLQDEGKLSVEDRLEK